MTYCQLCEWLVRNYAHVKTTEEKRWGHHYQDPHYEAGQADDREKMNPRSDAPITSSSGNSPTSSYATAPTSSYVNEATPGATFDAVYYEFKKNITRINTQGFWLPDCFLKALCKAKIDRRVATVLAAKPEGYVWSLMDSLRKTRTPTFT